MSARRPDGLREPHEIVMSGDPDVVVDDLLDNLAAAIPTPHGETARVLLERHRGVALPTQRGTDTDAGGCPGIDGWGLVPVEGVGVLRIEPAPVGPGPWTTIATDTANWIAVAVHAERARTTRDVAEREERLANDALVESEHRIERVREIERHRLVRLLTDATLPRFARVRGLLADGPEVNWGVLQLAMDDLIETLRSAVRGVFPAMLPDRGLTATLTELAATLAGTVRIRGDLGHRTGWEVETGFYHAVQAVLAATAASSDAVVEVRLTRTEDLVADIDARFRRGEAGALARTLAFDRERLHAVGGTLTVSPILVDGTQHARGARIAIRLPVHARTASRPLSPAELDRCAMHRRVSQALRRAELAEPLASELRAALSEPARLLLLQMPTPADVPGVTVLTAEAAPDGELAKDILAPDGPWGRVDAVLCGLPATPDFRRSLLGGPLVFHERVSQSQAIGFLRMRAPAMAAGRVLDRLREIAATTGGVRLRRLVEQVSVEGQAHEELRLLDAIVCGTAPSVLDVEAARLIGACGEDARSRLGLPPDAPAPRVREVAAASVRRWSAVASNAWFDRASREALRIVMQRASSLTLVGTADEVGGENHVT